MAEAAAPSLAVVAATLRDFVARSRALRAVALLDRDAGPPVVLDCDGRGAVEVEAAGEPRAALGAEAAVPLPVGNVRALPPMDVDAERGRVTGTVGGLQHLAEAVSALAQALGGRSVATVQFRTSDPGTPLAVSARPGEAPIVALGDEPFSLGPG